MRRFLPKCLVAGLIAAVQWFSPALAQQPVQSAAPSIMNGLSNLHHPVTTRTAEAQKFFDQGLRLIYAFNHDEARRAFEQAARLDANMAMAYWGIAKAVGTNYNVPVYFFPGAEKTGYDNIQKARSLEAKVSESERGYIEALAKRFTSDAQPDYRSLDTAYSNAMRDLSQRYPDDLDAATLFAESMMDLRPWKLWNHDGTPAEGTLEIISVLESVIRRDPNHIGAVHLHIHAVEASPTPDHGLASANRLASLAPNAGHLVHMPSHIFIRTGFYSDAARTNVEAAEVDEAFIKATGAHGIYPMMYYSHNLHFIAAAAMMNGRYAQAKNAAERLESNIVPHLKEMPMMEGFMTVRLSVDTRFHRWSDILKAREPDPAMKIWNSTWHYARGMALVATGKLDEAEKEHRFLEELQARTPDDAIFRMPANNKTKDILKIAANDLGSRIAFAKHEAATAVRLLEEGVAIEDSLVYTEPPEWYAPVRESLGDVLLATNNYSKAEEVYRADLERNPRNARSLLGLAKALEAQNKTYDASFVRQQFLEAWKDADSPADE